MASAGPQQKETEVENRWILGAGQVVEPWVVANPTPKYREMLGL